MRHLKIFFIIFSLLFVPIHSATASANIISQMNVNTQEISNDQETEKLDKEKIMEDSKKLGQDFKALFNNLTQLSKNAIEPLINNISEWITSNYAKLSETQRQKLVEFLATLKKEYKDIEKLSVETLNNILNNFKEFLRQLKENENPETSEPLTRTSGETSI